MRSIATACAITLMMAACVAASEPNPKSYVATASGNNLLLAANPGRGYTVRSVRLVASKQATGVVGVYFASTTEDLLGSESATIPIDKTSTEGPPGISFVDPVAVFAAPMGEPVYIVLDAAQPVIVSVTYSLR